MPMSGAAFHPFLSPRFRNIRLFVEHGLLREVSPHAPCCEWTEISARITSSSAPAASLSRTSRAILWISNAVPAGPGRL